MPNATLEKYLPRPRCESCGIGTVRPVDVMNGHVVFRCSIPKCYFNTHAELPSLTKTIIYLDTSTVSHMARAKAHGETDAPYMRLYGALRRASARNLVALPGSTIVETEAEFSKLADIIIEMSRHLSDPGLHHELQVKETQLFRALKRWLAGEPPIAETELPWRDAFQSDPDVWHSTFNVIVNSRTPEEFVDAAKKAKDRDLPKITEAYKAYADAGTTFEQIVDVEKRAFGLGVIGDGKLSIAGKIWFQRGVITNPVVLWPSTFEKIALAIQHERGCSIEDAFKAAIDFLASPAVAETPFGSISGRLQAGLAMLCRGANARKPKPGDQYDIQHMATFMPYVDVFIADGGIAALANQNHLRLGDAFDTTIRSLGENDIPDFIDWLESLADGNEVAALSERIDKAIWEGGFHQDFAENMKAAIPEAFSDTTG